MKNKIFQMLTSHGVKKENILFTDSLNEKNAIHFSSFEEFERFISERKTDSHISKSFFPLSKFEDSSFVGTKEGFPKSFHIQREMRGWREFHVAGDYYLVGNTDLKGYKITSYVTGFTFGITYEHKYGKLYFAGIDNLIVEGGGVINYNVFYEGIGTIFTDYLGFKADVNDSYREFDLYKSF